MNTENLHELIQRYEDGLDWIYGQKHDELFKWRAMATWRREWMEGNFDIKTDEPIVIDDDVIIR